jgi:hypothetical protein
MAEIPPTRASLLVRLRDPGDQAAWTEFTALYGPLIYNYVRKQGLQDADAADLGQEVLRAVAICVGRLEYDPGRSSLPLSSRQRSQSPVNVFCTSPHARTTWPVGVASAP